MRALLLPVVLLSLLVLTSGTAQTPSPSPVIYGWQNGDLWFTPAQLAALLPLSAGPPGPTGPTGPQGPPGPANLVTDALLTWDATNGGWDVPANYASNLEVMVNGVHQHNGTGYTLKSAGTLQIVVLSSPNQSPSWEVTANYIHS